MKFPSCVGKVRLITLEDGKNKHELVYVRTFILGVNKHYFRADP